LAQEYQRRLHAPNKEQQDLQAIQAQSVKVRKGIARLIDSYTAGYIEKCEFEPRIQRLRQRLAKLQDQEQQATTEMAQQAELQSAITHLEEFSSQVQDSLATADWSTKRDLIRTLVKKVEIYKEDVRIAFRVMPPPFDIGLGRGDSSLNRGNWQHCWRREHAFVRTALGKLVPHLGVLHSSVCDTIFVLQGEPGIMATAWKWYWTWTTTIYMKEEIFVHLCLLRRRRPGPSRFG
jgi:site-specific DNA recombinase